MTLMIAHSHIHKVLGKIIINQSKSMLSREKVGARGVAQMQAIEFRIIQLRNSIRK